MPNEASRSGRARQAGRWVADPGRGRRNAVVRVMAAAMSVSGISLSLAAATGMVMASAAKATTSGADSCGYPSSSSARAATVFNESTTTRAVQVVGSGASARVVVFSNDENGVLLGVGNATHYTGASHVPSPSLGDTSATDPFGRPLYPALFVTNVTSNTNATTGDWQQGGAPTRFLSDVFGTWATGQMASGTYHRDTLPAKNGWTLGAGSDTPSAGFAALGNEGYGTEFSWNVSALGLQPGNTYRVQVMTHDGDQNNSGGDVGEACARLTIPGNPAAPAVSIDKTNNAAGTGFAKATVAPSPGASVPFQVVVRNTSQEQETVTSVSDSYSGQAIAPDCRDAGGTALNGRTLAVGEVLACTFTLPSYAPAAGTSLPDTVQVTVTDPNGRTASDTSSSTVSTPGPHIVPDQSIAGSILLCDTSGNRTSTAVNGGSLQALSGGSVVLGSANQMAPASVPAGTYTLSANAPPGYQFLACGVTGVNIASPTLASQPVVVPSGGAASGVFYVSPVPITATIDKTNNAAGTGYGKVELAGSPSQDVPFRAVITNTSPVPVVITSLSDSWPGQALFTPSCAQSVVGDVLAANGGSITCDFTITRYSPPAGQWLVDTVTATLSQLDVQSNSTVASNSTTVTNTSTVGTTKVLGEQVSPPTTQGLVTQPPTQVLGTQLAFTGIPGWVWTALEAGLAMMSVGFFVLWLTRPRETDGLIGTA